MKKKALPKIVSNDQWHKARAIVLKKEKKLMKEADKLSALRRELPMVLIDEEYVFEGPKGKVSLLDLFEGRDQLIIYHFMYHSKDDSFCVGCSMFTDQVANLEHLNARSVSFSAISRAPMKSILRHKKRLGWDIPWNSSLKTTFNEDFGITTPNGENHGLSVFIRDGKKIYRTYFTTARGVEPLGTTWSLLDVVPYGRQEKGEVSPKGWPQSDPYVWWKFHDQY